MAKPISSCISNNEFLLNSLIKAAIDGINPKNLLSKYLKIETQNHKDYLGISSSLLCSNFKNNKQPATQPQSNFDFYELNKNVYVVSFGKASLPMSMQIEKIFESSAVTNHLVKGLSILPYSQIVNVKTSNDKENYFSLHSESHQVSFISSPSSKFQFYYGAKNTLPDRQSLDATKHALEMIQEMKQNASTENNVLLICLISGGGSALLTHPNHFVDASDEAEALEKNLQLKRETIKRVVEAGSTINELNVIRSCLSQVKAGNLAKLALACQSVSIVSLIISDVINDPLDIIASGPTYLGDEFESSRNKYEKSLDVLNKYNLASKIPKEIHSYLQSKRKSLDLNEEIPQVSYKNRLFNYLIGNNKLASSSMLAKSEQDLSFNYCQVLTNSLEGKNIKLKFFKISNCSIYRIDFC